MLTSIRDIGDRLLSGSDERLLDVMTINIPVKDAKKTGTKQHVVIVKFDTENYSISSELRELKQKSSGRFLWVGNASGPSSFQWLATTNSLNFLCSQTLPSLYERLDEKSALRQKIGSIIDNCYTSFSDDIGKRYRLIWDLDKLGIDEGFSPQKLEENFKAENKKRNVKNKDQKLVAEVAKTIDEYIQKQLFLDKSDEIALYTIKIDEDFICDDKDYKELIYQDKVGEIFQKSKKAYVQFVE